MTLPGKKCTQAVWRAVFISIWLFTACHTSDISALPNITLPDINGGTFHLRSYPAQPLLLAFLQTFPDTAGTPSHSQVVFLSSMANQYGPRGLRVAIVDATILAHSSQPSRDALLNASYDWHLSFPLLLDKDLRLAHQLGVQQVPTTFLISADGQVLHQWRGFTRPAVLAQAIEKLLGGPLAQTP